MWQTAVNQLVSSQSSDSSLKDPLTFAADQSGLDTGMF